VERTVSTSSEGSRVVWRSGSGAGDEGIRSFSTIGAGLGVSAMWRTGMS
jgi:hypothetical protein